uniref:DUF4817 domain-containing protein n=1 Tax=Tetranychus urticae TaxID=32264 RepID=T1KSD6_TETUR
MLNADHLNKDHRVWIVITYYKSSSPEEVAVQFAQEFPGIEAPTIDTIQAIFNKFEKTGNIHGDVAPFL